MNFGKKLILFSLVIFFSHINLWMKCKYHITRQKFQIDPKNITLKNNMGIDLTPLANEQCIWHNIQHALLTWTYKQQGLLHTKDKQISQLKERKVKYVTKYTTGLAVSNWKEFKISISAAFHSPRRTSFPSSSNALTWRHEFPP